MRPLGTPGAQGEVYEVFDLHEEDTAALKLLTSLPPAGVWVEARILRRLSDRHILPIRNADVTPQGVPYIVTDLAQQGSLDHLLVAGSKLWPPGRRRGPLDTTGLPWHRTSARPPAPPQ
ncbi:MAG: hypothetical protein ACREMY_11730 [bacterium]